jgi:hypothetical protein
MHAPIFGSMLDLGLTEAQLWERVSRCAINQTWSAMITVVDGELLAYFCEIAATMAELTGDKGHGITPFTGWYHHPASYFERQIRHACVKCLVPMNGRKLDAAGQDPELYTRTWAPVMLTLKGRPMRQVCSAAEASGDGVTATHYVKR